MSPIVHVAFVAASCTGDELRARVPDAEVAPHRSVSHTSGLSAIAWSDARVGVDVEVVRARVKLDRLAVRTMTPSEYAAWSETPDRDRGFAQHWTRVEAYLKAIGVGVRGGYLTRPGKRWSVIDLDLGGIAGTHVGALAVESDAPVVSVRWLPARGTSG